jgi:multiple sugar transport system permease protein
MSSSVSLRGRLRFELWRYALILLAVGFSLIPIVWMITMALKPVEEWTDAGAALHWWPRHPTVDNFRYIFGYSSSKLITSLDTTAARPILASMLSATIGTIIAMLCGASAAYGVSRFKAGGNLPLALLQLRIFPPMAVMIPVMIMWTFLGLIDTWYGLALIYGIVTMPFAFWLMKTFFDEMPKELEEAALVEGCSRFRVFRRVTLPMMMAPFASAALLVFIFNWSDYLIALLLTTKDWRTIPVYMASLSSSMTGQLYGAKAALGLIAAVPPIVLGLSIQRYLVRGLTFGALKQ